MVLIIRTTEWRGSSADYEFVSASGLAFQTPKVKEDLLNLRRIDDHEKEHFGFRGTVQ
jgi:hypothetical protein